MRVFRNLANLPEDCLGAVIALGNFEGLHRGHRMLLARVQEIARREGRPGALMTFAPHPRRYFNPATGALAIHPPAEKLRLLRRLGMDACFLLRFNAQLATLSAEDFIQEILVGKLRAHHIITGENFTFGKGRQGNATMLAAAGAFGYTCVAAQADTGGQAYSTTRIRAALAQGDVILAGELLGEPYHITGRVQHGDGRGRQLGFPTANIHLPEIVLPAYGVYAVETPLGKAVANLGLRPTLGRAEKPRLEVHIPGFTGDLYGKKLKITFTRHLRPEQKFESLEALTAQIARDTQEAMR